MILNSDFEECRFDVLSKILPITFTISIFKITIHLGSLDFLKQTVTAYSIMLTCYVFRRLQTSIYQYYTHRFDQIFPFSFFRNHFMILASSFVWDSFGRLESSIYVFVVKSAKILMVLKSDS